MIGEQRLFYHGKNPGELASYLSGRGVTSVFLIGGQASENSQTLRELEEHRFELVKFHGYSPNPGYEEIADAIGCFREKGCNGILAIGGGSAIDTAKCVKAFLNMDSGVSYLAQKSEDNGIPLVVLPTTAGTGSEATRFAVLYDGGVKYSVEYEHLLPEGIIFEPELLESLPVYQKKSALMDALCQCIESYWSRHASEESRGYAAIGIRCITKHLDAYLSGDAGTYGDMQYAAYMSGKAINLSKTTAAHALSYKLTSLYGVPHGHAVAICMRQIWPYLVKTAEQRAKESIEAAELGTVLLELSRLMGDKGTLNDAFEQLYVKLKFPPIRDFRDSDIEVLCSSVNTERLSNMPIVMETDVIRAVYKAIFLQG